MPESFLITKFKGCKMLTSKNRCIAGKPIYLSIPVFFLQNNAIIISNVVHFYVSTDRCHTHNKH